MFDHDSLITFLDCAKAFGLLCNICLWPVFFATWWQLNKARRVLEECRTSAVKRVHLLKDYKQIQKILLTDRDELLMALDEFVAQWRTHISDAALLPLVDAANAARDNVGKQWCPCCMGVDEANGRPATSPLCVKCKREADALAKEARRKAQQEEMLGKIVKSYFDFGTLMEGENN